MKRALLKELNDWKANPSRRPVLLRGARQVGKTHLVRELGKSFPHFVEVNFEKNLEAANVFAGNLEPDKLVRDLSLILKEEIIPGKTLLFLDEAQIIPRSIIALRYFYEEMPDLHVIAAGSLLDFAIDEVGVPVGRVDFFYLHPMSFMEFLCAIGRSSLAKVIVTQKIDEPLSESIHNLALEMWGNYMALGGMPKVVQEWADNQNIKNCQSILHSINNNYIEDFSKYAKESQIKYLDILFKKIPRLISRPFNFTEISTNFRRRELEPALMLLHKAGLVQYVYHSHGNGFPIAAESDFNKFKLIFLDCGLTQAVNGVDLKDWFLHQKEAFINNGPLTEAFVGQEFLAYGSSTTRPNLYYWTRQAPGSNAEVDYLMSQNQAVIPVEVKSGKGGQLQSMRHFLAARPKSPYGIRFSTHNFSVHENLHSYPIYAVANACKFDLGFFSNSEN